MEKHSRTSRSSLSGRIVAVVFASVAAISIAIPAANAATYTYANNVPTAEGVERDSGMRTSITGGSAAVTLGIGTRSIATYYPAPGYTTVAYASSAAPNPTVISHKRVSNARSKCSWHLNGLGGHSPKLTCKVIW